MKAIILDMYGVIVKQTGDDFVPYVHRTFPDLPDDAIRTPWFKADRGQLTSLQVWEAIGFTGDLEQIEREYLDTIELHEGFHDFAAAMKKKYKLAILSDDSSRWSRYLREHLDIAKYFDAVTISGDVGITKPDERVYRLTLEKLGCEPADCVYVDDRRKNLAAARTLGMETVLFNSRDVAWEGKTVNSFAELTVLLSE